MSTDRRRVLMVAGASVGAAVLGACGGAQREEREGRRGGGPRGDEAQEVSPVEDLMQEHGLLERLLGIYEESARRLRGNETFGPAALHEATAVVQTFVHDYHERNEEQSIFPRAESTATLQELVRTLRMQHQRGREITAMLTQLADPAVFADTSRHSVVIAACESFARMYRPHAARENSVLFPASRALFTHHAWHELGEHFEQEERRRFGAAGFEGQVSRVADIERELGIEDLARMTAPAVT